MSFIDDVLNENYGSKKRKKEEERRAEAERTKQLAKTDYTKMETTQKPQVTGLLSSEQTKGATKASNSNGNNLWDNVLNIAKGISLGKHGEQFIKDERKIENNALLGATMGLKQVPKFYESAQEVLSPSYKDTRNKQYYSSSKVSEVEKAFAKKQTGFIPSNENEIKGEIKGKGNIAPSKAISRNIVNQTAIADDIIKKTAKNKTKTTVNPPSYNIKPVNENLDTNLIKRGLDQSIQKDQTVIAQNTESIDNPVMKKVSELALSVGQMGVGMALNQVPVVGQVLGTTYFVSSAAGGYLDDAKARGMNDKQALNYATIMGGVEGGSEALTASNLHKAGLKMKSFIGKEAVKEVAKEGTKTGLKSALKDYGIGIGENFIQEALIVPASEATATIVGGKDKADWNNIAGRMVQDGIDGALVAVITGGAELGVQSCVGVAEKSKNGQTVTREEYQQAIQDASKKMDIKGIMKDSMNYTTKKYINYNLQQNQAENRNNTQGQQITQPEIKMAQNVENNNSVMYNNNESEGGINGEIQQQGLLGSNNELAGLYEDSQHQQTKRYTRAEYEQWEQSIKPIKETNITIEQRTVKDNLKRQYNKDIVFFDGTNNKGYSGGASYSNPNRINIDVKQAETFGLNKMVYHELLESNILHNKSIKENGIEVILQKIIEDANFENQKQLFWKEQTDRMPNDYLIAKDILCDRFSEIKTGENVDYQNVLSQETNMTIDFAIENLEKAIRGQNNQKQEVNLPVRKLTYDESVKKYNIDGNNETVKSIKRVLEERGIQGRFDDTIFTDNTQDAVWIPTKNSDGTITREVVFNPNAVTEKTLQNISVHEMAHDFEGSDTYSRMRELVLKNASTKSEYLEARKGLEETYSRVYDKNSENFQKLVDDEAVASILGNKLGDQDFINSLVKQDRTTMQKIYDWIVDKLNKLTGYSNEKIFWEDIKRKFEIAYNEEYKGNNENSKYHTSQNLSNDIDNILTNINERNPVRLRDYTPRALVENGIKDLPMYENPSHIRKNILTQNEAKKAGLSITTRDHYHGLGKETYIKAIDSLDTPRVIFKNKNNPQDYLILTVVKDSQDNNIVVPIEIETSTNVNKIKIDINRVKSIYGFEQKNNINLNDYIKYNIKNNNFEKIYEQKIDRGTGFSTAARSNNSITPTKTDVNPKYSMQELENNSGSFNLPVKDSKETNMTMDFAIENFEKAIRGQNNQKQEANLPLRKLTYGESVKKYNIDSNNETVKSIKRVLEERGIQGRFDDTIFTDNTQDAVWIPTQNSDGTITREIVFNPNAVTEKTLQNISVHEMAHDFEGSDTYSRMRELVLKNASTKSEYLEARKGLEETYSRVYDKNSENFQKLVDDEAVASILGNKLGDQDFINSLVKQDRTTMQKIYDWIVDKLNKLTGYSNERIFWEDIKRKFEVAYNEEYQSNFQKEKYHISEKFSEEIDKSLKGEIPSNNQIKARDYTPKILVENGVKDLPMLLTQRHLRQIIYTKQEAVDLGYRIDTKDHYHGLGKEKLLKAIDNLDNPKEIYKQSDSNYLIITEMKDNNNNQIIVPIQINGTGTYNDVRILENQIASVYGRKNLEKYINDNSLEKIYEKNRNQVNSEGVKSHDSITVSNNSITPTKTDVNPKYSMQELEKNSGSFNLPVKDSKETNMTMDFAIENFEKAIRGQNNQKQEENLPLRKLTYGESVKKYNIDSNNETVKSIKRVLEERGIQGRFDDTIFTDNTQDAVWIPTQNNDGTITREIVFNPNAVTEKTLQNISVHEMAHDFEGSDTYSRVREIILKNASTKSEYLEARKALEDTYSRVYDKNSEDFQKLVDDEAVASILGNKLGDQDFINRLVKQDRTTMQKIYDWIVDKLNKLTGYSNERIFWEDVKRKLEVAYNEEYKGNNTSSKLSIQTDAKGNKYIKVDTDQNIFEGIEKKDYNKIAKMYIQDYLMGETTLAQNDKAKIDSRSANKYTNPRQRTSYMNEKMQLTPELKNVLKIAQKDSVALPIKENSKYNSWEYYKFNFELDGKNFEGTLNIGIDKDGNKHFYEINKIRFTGISSVSTNSQHKTDFIDNSILPTNKNVNNTTKYSMQKSDNNSSSFNLPVKDSKENTLSKEQQNYFKDSRGNSDIRYSKSTGTWQDFLDKNHPNSGKGKTMQDVKLPVDKSKVTQQPSNETKSSNTTSYNLPISENTKQRKHYKSIIESSNISDEAKKITKELIKADTYVPESNKKQLVNADSRIETAIQLSGKEGIDAETTSLLSRAMNGEKITADDIALGERLIQYYSKTGDKVKLQEAIQATAMAGTTAGQTVQALSLLNHQTPEGQAIWLQRSVDKMNKELIKKRGQKAEQFNLTDDMLQKIANSQNSEELHNNLNEVYAELGQQVSKTTAQKIDAWRYFSMLANPRTHIRNIVGNTAMAGVQGVKNKVAGVIEEAVSAFNLDIERTHTVKIADKAIKEFAKNDIKNVADRLELNDNKYNPKTRLENSMRTFKSDIMENTIGRLFNLNDNLLEAEDGWGLKAGYKKALSEYIVANNLDINNISDKELAKARNYAVEQAKEATFHQASSLASALNQFQNKNGLTKFATDAILPFKKTPINVAKVGIEYSPVGLAKSVILDTVQLRKGNITVNKYIDNISKGLTGTGIAVLGYALADAGILKASGGDDEDKEKFDEARGSQTYSIQIGDNTYSLDWLAPSGIPLFIGAETFEVMKSSKEKKSSSTDEDSTYKQAITSATNILDSFTNAMNPMSEMSMLSGLTSALKSYDQGSSQMLASIGTNAVKSYVNQFVPTALGQVAKTTDEYERSTTSTETGVLPKAIDTTKNQVMSKVPGLRQMLPIKTDTWGNEMKQNDSIIIRALENSTFPWTRKEITTTNVDKFILDVYNNTGESSVLPDSINKKIKIDGEDYTLTSKEYAKYKQQYGQTSYELLDKVRKSNNMTDEQKQFTIEKIYSYTKEQIKVDYAKENNLNYEQSTISKIANKLEESNQDTSSYFKYLVAIKDMEKSKDKMNTLVNMKCTNTTKKIIYQNSLGKEDDLYSTLSSSININEYLNYKVAKANDKFVSDKKEDGTSISGTAKNKLITYLNKNVTGYKNRIAIVGKEYKLSSEQQKDLADYIETNIPREDRLKVYKSYSKNFTVKDGKVYYK